jgi:hypothetical protein
MYLHFAAAILLSVVGSTPLAAMTKCDPLPTLQISDVRQTLIGNSLVADRAIDGTAFKDSTPLAFAEVQLLSGKNVLRRTVTDFDGHFLLEDLSEGRYILAFEGMGSFQIEVTPARFSQQFYYGFSRYHGCLGWGSDTN